MVQCFRCARTGLYYPLDYIERWGEKYGRGLGVNPVSEAFVNSYSQRISKSRIKVDKPMHPIEYCRAQLDYVEVADDEYARHQPIIIMDDPTMREIYDIMWDKQIQKSHELQSLFPDEKKRAAERIALRIDKNMAKIAAATAKASRK